MRGRRFSYSNSRSLSYRRGRDHLSIASALALPHATFTPSPRRVYPSRANKLALARLMGEDRRFFHPAGSSRPARSMRGTIAQVTAVPSPVARASVKFRFALPEQTVICVRRNIRKEVLHAKRRTGKRTSFPRKRRRNYASSISC